MVTPFDIPDAKHVPLIAYPPQYPSNSTQLSTFQYSRDLVQAGSLSNFCTHIRNPASTYGFSFPFPAYRNLVHQSNNNLDLCKLLSALLDEQ